MSANSLLKQYSDERAALVQNILPRAVAVILGRRRVLSGIHWGGDLIITAAEAIGGAEHVDVRLDGDELGAEVIATDLTTDVAILRAAGGDTGGASTGGASSGPTTPGDPTGSASSGPTTPGDPAGGASSVPTTPGAAAVAGRPVLAGARSNTLRTSRAAALRVGETIVVVGRSLRGAAAIWGNVQLIGPAWNSRRGGKIDQRIELDVGFDPSFEGGAVIDMDGNIAAMAVPGPYHRVLGIPTATIENIVAKVDKFGHLPKPYVGIRLQPLWLDDATRTKLGRKSRGIAAVGGVDAGSPAAEAHIELGDLLLALDGEPAESVTGLAQRIASTNPGQTIALEVLRGGKPLTINVRIAERPRS